MKKIIILSITLSSLLTQGFAREFEFGKLTITTYPDSAGVVLNDIKEQEVTPYSNDKMVLGKHKVTLLPKNNIYKKANYVTDITLEKKSQIKHTFLYRNKSFLNENLSLDKFRFQIETGFVFQNHSGMYESTVADEKIDEFNFADSLILKQYQIPFILRMGLPHNFELHTMIPIQKSGTENSDAQFGNGDITIGVKYTHRKFNSAVNLNFKFANADTANGGTEIPSVALSLITLQSYLGIELLAQGGYEMLFSKTSDNKYDGGDRIFGYVQAGYLLGSVLPYLAIEADYVFTSTYDSEPINDDWYRGGLELGAIIDITPELTLQAGIPFSVIGYNSTKQVGFKASASYSFKLLSANKSVTKATFTPPFQYDSTAAKNSRSTLIFDDTEVSNAQFKEFCDRTRTTYPEDPGFDGIEDYFRNPEYKDYPVVNVSYADAIRYAQWSNKRLPTAEEWKKEFSALKIDSTNIVSNMAAPQSVTSIEQGNTLYHVIGNVSEWVIEEGINEYATTSFHAGCSYNMPLERCTNPERLIDMASATGAKFIGFRCVTDLK